MGCGIDSADSGLRWSSPIRRAKTRQQQFGLLITAAGGNAYTLAQPSPVPLVLSSQACWCLKFHFLSRTPVIGRDGCYCALGNECRTVLSVHDHHAVRDASREQRETTHSEFGNNCTADGLNIPNRSSSCLVSAATCFVSSSAASVSI